MNFTKKSINELPANVGYKLMDFYRFLSESRIQKYQIKEYKKYIRKLTK